MKYAEAFRSLGYSLTNIRQDWTAINDTGVCVTMWTEEIKTKNKLLYLDLWELHPIKGGFETKSGHTKRTSHLIYALENFQGFVDAILVRGKVGVSYEDADPWDIEKRKGRWFISKFCPDTGYFRADIKPLEKA